MLATYKRSFCRASIYSSNFFLFQSRLTTKFTASTKTFTCHPERSITPGQQSVNPDPLQPLSQVPYSTMPATVKREASSEKAYPKTHRPKGIKKRQDSIRRKIRAITVEAYGCIAALLTSSGHSNKTQLLTYSIATGKETMFDILLADDTMVEPTEKERVELLRTAINQGKVWFVKRIVNHYKIAIDPVWLGPLVSTTPRVKYSSFASCEVLRQCLNIMKASMDGKLPQSKHMPLRLAREQKRHDMACLMEAFLRNEPLTKVISKEEQMRLILNSRK
jgi:hypothetical protein